MSQGPGSAFAAEPSATPPAVWYASAEAHALVHEPPASARGGAVPPRPPGRELSGPFVRISNGNGKTERMTATENEDALLLRDLIAGDEWAFTELYRRRRGEIYRFAFAMTRSAALAQDVMQDVFLRLLEDAARFDPSKGTVRAWLLGCARHVVLDRLRAEGRCATEAPADDESIASCPAEDAVFQQQRLAQLHAAILSLPMEFREAVALCEIAELSYAECAAVLGCPIGTVRSRLHRARALLARRLADTVDGEAPLRRVNEVCG
nr:hypothetical protein [Gammaproteobacteria bacterium]